MKTSKCSPPSYTFFPACSRQTRTFLLQTGKARRSSSETASGYSKQAPAVAPAGEPWRPFLPGRNMPLLILCLWVPLPGEAGLLPCHGPACDQHLRPTPIQAELMIAAWENHSPASTAPAAGKTGLNVKQMLFSGEAS